MAAFDKFPGKFVDVLSVIKLLQTFNRRAL
jgi:hypothetical protein